MGADIVVMQLQAKGHQGLLKATKNQQPGLGRHSTEPLKRQSASPLTSHTSFFFIRDIQEGMAKEETKGENKLFSL